MPLVRVQIAETGETAYVDAADAQAGIEAGVYRPVGQVLAETEGGERFAVEAGAGLGSLGLEQGTAEDVAELAQAQADAEIAGGFAGSGRAFLTGLADSATVGAYSALSGEEERANIARLRREQGGSYVAGRLVGDVGLGVASASRGAVGELARALPGGMVSRASERLVAGGVAGSRVLGAVAGGALEGAAGAAADYLADQALAEKPALSGEAFAQQVGLGALLGGGIGGALGGIGAVVERRGARRGADAVGGLPDSLPPVPDTERAAMAAIEDLAGESERVPLTSLIPPRAATPEGVAERVGGVFGALRQADSERIAMQREIDDLVLPGLDTLPAEQRDAIRAELGAAIRAHKTAIEDAKGWARGLDREQRALTRARIDEERVRGAAGRTDAQLEREGIRTRVAEETAAQRIERERLRTQRLAEGPQRRTRPEPETAIPETPPGDDLLQQLQRTQEQVTGGRSLREVTEETAATAPKPKRPRRGRPPKTPSGFSVADDVPRRSGLPGADDVDEGAVYVVKPADLRARLGPAIAQRVDAGRVASIKRGWADGKSFEPLDIRMSASGKLDIDEGVQRLHAALDEGRSVAVRIVREIEPPPVAGRDAVAEWLAKYRRPDVRYVSTSGRGGGARPRSVDKIVTPQGPPDEALPEALDLAEFRRAEPGEVAARLGEMRARDPEIELAAARTGSETARTGAEEAAEEVAETSPGARQYGRLLDGDSDDAVDVFARLDEAAESLRRALARAKQAPAQSGLAAVSLPEPPAAPAGGSRLIQRAQDIGGAIEAANALGLPVPSAGQIPVIGPALSAYLRMRAAWRALRGTSAMAPATPAAKAAAARVRIEQAARASVTRVLELGERALTSDVLPGMTGRQAGRLADALRDREAEQREMRGEIDAVMQARPDLLQLQIAQAGAGTPLPVTQAAQEAAARAVAYLQEVAPRPATEGTPWAGVPRYTATQQAQWRQRLAAVQRPQDAAQALSSGVTAPWAREALVRVWPEIWGLWREELSRQQDVLAQLSRPQRMAIGRNFDLALDPSQLPFYPRASATPASAMQPTSPAAPTRAPQPSVKPRVAEVYATPEQAQAIQ